MTTKTVPTDAFSVAVIRRWEQVGSKLLTLAEGFPEEKCETAPVDGIRSFADVLRHVVLWNQYVAATVRREKADDTANELSKTKYPDKARV